MLGEQEAVEDDRAFNKAPVWKRLLIVLAGAVVNIVFGLIVFWILASIYNKNLHDGLVVTKRYIMSIFESFSMLFKSSQDKIAVMGPVGISEMIVKTNGLFDFVYLLSVISVSLGITNLLPIPALDGGKILILLIELIRRKPIKQNTELTITAIGLFTLLTIAVMTTVNDVGRIF
ncbi:MAG: hypothetical protein HFJ45_07780 [Clostridia bacterium]|nr:hypothetical protein [Clostridia bacterium]